MNKCEPPEGTKNQSNHLISVDIGDGTKKEIKAMWLHGYWVAPFYPAMLPVEAADVFWQYVRMI